MVFKWSKEKQTRSAQQRDFNDTPQSAQLWILTIVDSPGPAEETHSVSLWRFLEKRSMQYPQSSGFVEPRWWPTPKPSSAWPLHSSSYGPHQKMPLSVEEQVHGVTQHPSPLVLGTRTWVTKDMRPVTVWWPTSQVTRSSCHDCAVWSTTQVTCTEFGCVSSAVGDTCPIDFGWIGLSFEKKKN